ncbi:TOM1-like protein 2 isoform X2 [Condylostylus longicornis]|uniref:TOM1-like protein 2 isoform X2 n=1 Tax=Condylostylus longicornis TaxID=2530218 RepID=UPI00244DBB8C|nr:TOM1-like protein 2 isoform X2 [Condylostylus longicornis]
MASFFNSMSNPFASQIGQRIEQATDASLASENWALNMEICDMINESSDTARDAMKAIRKRLTQSAGKNNQVIMYTLIVLETCVKNCGKAFHVLVANKEFIQELVKIIGPKNDPPKAVQEKVLNLIQVWADAFKNQPDLNGVVQVYQELKNKGIEFPVNDVESMAPIYTPQRSVPETTPVQPPPMSSPQHGVQISPASAAISNGPSSLSPEQTSKLQSELDIVSMNMSILGEMLNEMKPGQEDPSDYKLLNDLVQTCKEMQGRIVDLIGRITNDEITAELLRLNDELNNLFLRHQRYEKNRDPNSTNNTPSAILGAALGVPLSKEKEKPKDELIDLSDGATGGSGTEDISSQFSRLGMGTASSQLSKLDGVQANVGKISKDADEFDMLAQSRNVTTDPSKINSVKDIPIVETNVGNQNKKDIEGTEEILTSTEFDKFLAERAAAAENLPTLSIATNNINEDTEGNRQKKKKDDENLLAL